MFMNQARRTPGLHAVEGAILTAAGASMDPAGDAQRIRAEMVARCG